MPTDAEIPASALAVYAHPDDPEISAGGTLAGWAEAGADVWVLITTRGDKGTPDPDTDLEELAELRIEETAKAAALLGFAGHFHLGYPDGELPDDQTLRVAVHHVQAVYLSGTLEPNCWIDISATLERKIDALFCHASQLTETGEWFRQFLRDRAEEAGRAAGVAYSEGFRRLTFGG